MFGSVYGGTRKESTIATTANMTVPTVIKQKMVGPPGTAPVALEELKKNRAVAQTIAAAAITPRATYRPGPEMGHRWRTNTATQTTTASPERFQASAVRSRARPTCAGRSAATSVASDGGKHNREHADSDDADGENEGQDRARKRFSATHRLVIGSPLPEALRRRNGA